MIVALAAVTAGLAIAVVAVTAGFVALLVRILSAIDAGTGPEQSSGTGGGGQGADDRPGPPWDGGGDPAWWPGFERELARYAADRAAGRAPVTIGGS